MDLLDFGGEKMYFDQPLGEEAEGLIAMAAEQYGQPAAEHRLMRAYFLEPEHLTVLVALYRYFYYRRQYADALIVADRAIVVASRQLNLSDGWRALSQQNLVSNSAAFAEVAGYQPEDRFQLFLPLFQEERRGGTV